MGDLDAEQYVKIRLKVVRGQENNQLFDFLVNAVSDADIRPWKVRNC